MKERLAPFKSSDQLLAIEAAESTAESTTALATLPKLAASNTQELRVDEAIEQVFDLVAIFNASNDSYERNCALLSANRILSELQQC